MHQIREGRSAVVLSITVSVLIGMTSQSHAAALQFTKPHVEPEVRPGAESVSHTFTFTNTSDKTVTITKRGTSCGCTIAEAKDQTIQPGASGKVTA